jgi:acetyl esterase/lipase
MADDIGNLQELDGFECDIICGTEDDVLDGAVRLAESLATAKVEHRLLLVEDMGHDFPRDFEGHLRRILRR